MLHHIPYGARGVKKKRDVSLFFPSLFLCRIFFKIAKIFLVILFIQEDLFSVVATLDYMMRIPRSNHPCYSRHAPSYTLRCQRRQEKKGCVVPILSPILSRVMSSGSSLFTLLTFSLSSVGDKILLVHFPPLSDSHHSARNSAAAVLTACPVSRTS